MAATQFSRPFTVWDCLDHRRPLGRRIEAERRRLNKASAVLTALECALNEEEIEPIVAADAANVVRGLIDRAIDRLDVVSLARGEAMPPATGSGVLDERTQVERQAGQSDVDGREQDDDGPDVDDDEEGV